MSEAKLSEQADATPDADTVLRIRDLHAWYGESHVLHGIGLHMRRGEVVTLLGRNGAGKSTTLRSVMGILRQRRGSILVNGTETVGIPSRRIARCGIAHVPEERGIYASLSVRENLLLPPVISDAGMSESEIFALFPNLRERLSSQGSKLSGGEQQMLAMARVLRTGAQILLLDEPTEGLAPIIVEQIRHALVALKQRGYTILLVEQNFRFTTALATRHYILDQGVVVDSLDNDQVLQDERCVTRYLGV